MRFIPDTFLLILIFLLGFQDFVSAEPPISSPLEQPLKEEEVTTGEKNLKILSWNIYMLPRIVVQKHKRGRAYAIVEELKKSEFDIIVFQEAFFPASREIIKNGLREIFPFDYGPANNEGLTLRTNSGIWIISKTPLKVLKTTQFKACTGNDCWARKGAMLLEGTWHDKPFQILGTHLQADGFDKIREKQMDQIYLELLAENKKEGVPQIICGDMNTEREMKEHYCKMLDCLDAEDGEISGIETCSYDGVDNEIAQSFGAKKKTNYDYILVRNNGSKMKAIHRLVNIYKYKNKKKHLSDHYGIACELKF
jgi:endonuclease/exonuclease/phosphatase family metal-dependent hydrolase